MAVKAAGVRRFGGLVRLLAQGVLTVSVADRFPLEQAAAALAQANPTPCLRAGLGPVTLALLTM